MAQPNTQAGLGHPSGAAGQPQVPQRQAPVGEKTLTPLPQRPADGSAMHAPRAQSPVAAQGSQSGRATAPNTPPDDDQESSDWGLAPAKSGISRENKFILFVLLVLVAVFSFVVFRNFQKKHNLAKTAAEVASNDGKSDAGKSNAGKLDHKTDHQHKHDSQPGEDHAPPLQELDAAEAHLDDEPFASAADSASDPFNAPANTPATEEAPPTKHRAARESHHGEHHAEVGQMPEAGLLHEPDAPPQLNATADGIPAQATDLFDLPAESTPIEDLAMAEQPAMTEIAEAATPVRRGRRQVHSQPEVVEDTTTEFADPMQGIPAQIDPMHQPAEVAGIDVSEPAFANEFAQTAGTAAEPIHQRGRGTTPRVGGFETAQAPMHTEVPGGVPEHLTPPPPTTPRTTVPHSAGTAPRTAITPTPATPTQPRVGSVPPPLDPADERLGGYQDAGLPPAGATHRTASRPHAPVTPSQFNPHHEPLVANVGEYVVRPNDNYWRISRKVYGTARYFAALAKHNEVNVPDPRHMKPGIKISTPIKEQLEQQYGNLLPIMAASRPVGAVTHSPNAPKTPGYFVEADGQPAYRIGPSDTLSGISQKTLGRSTRWEEIYDLNKERLSEPDALSVGSILRLPPDASQTRVVGRPVEHR